MCLCLAAIACGGGNPAQPSGSGSGSGSGSTPNKGTLTCLVDGVSYLNVNAASYANGILNVASNNAALTLSVNFAVRGGVGTTQVSSGNATVGVITTSGTTVTGTWIGTILGGSGSVSIATLTSSGASGTFSFMAPAVPPPSGAGATGTRNVTNGVFNVTF